ncbi:MAG TPA: PRC-barrel domain-containing protein [Burkholderiaceae bacterium]|nr:PRC-barrel domain-containing protein [Burkholderiaceae bacterium]
MHYQDRDADGVYVDTGHHGPGPDLMGAGTVIGDPVRNLKGEHLGQIREIMLDMRSGTIAYAVMAHGGVFHLGAKLFAVPWQALTLDPAHKGFTLNIDKQRLDEAPGFDPDHWPNMANPAWAAQIHQYYAHPAEQGSGLS